MSEWLLRAMPHLIIAPILLPLLAAALMLLLGERRRQIKAVVNLASCLLGLAVAVALLQWVDDAGVPGGAIGVYLPANWDPPFGIVLALDRLSALMLVLGALVGLAAVLYSLARWDRAGVHFHPLFQLQLMGLNGAFLTGDLFNLFVFFEVLLVASYGLLLHGSGRTRVQAGLHYIAINLVASLLFLIGVSMLYGVVGTLNMADLAHKIPHIQPGDRGLLHAAAAILAVAFLAKAAAWPLNFWLMPAYEAAAAPVAALFAILTKVGVYTVLRVSTLLFSADAGGSALFGHEALLWGGLATLAFGAVGMLASSKLSRLASFGIIMSSGTLLAATGLAQAALTAGALFYLVSSTLAASALFLLHELVERTREAERPIRPPDDDADHIPFAIGLMDASERGTNLDELEEPLIGSPIPAAMAFLGLTFVVCAMVLAGMPPLSGFVGKFGMLTALLNPAGLGADTAWPAIGAGGWMLLALLIGSGLLSIMALSRAGVRYFWAPQGRPVPRLRVAECLPIGVLLAACVAITVQADPVMRYAKGTADLLYEPSRYIAAVLSAQPVRRPATAPAEATGEGAE